MCVNRRGNSSTIIITLQTTNYLIFKVSKVLIRLLAESSRLVNKIILGIRGIKLLLVTVCSQASHRCRSIQFLLLQRDRKADLTSHILGRIEHLQYIKRLTTLRQLSNPRIYASYVLIQKKHILRVATCQNFPNCLVRMFSSGP